MKRATRKTFYNLMLTAMGVRLFWLVFMEPHGARQAVQKVSELNSLPGMAAQTLPFVVYPSIIILMAIIIGALLKKRWAYMAGIIFGAAHLVLTASVAVMKVNPGYGPAVVLPASLMIVVFSYLVYQRSAHVDQST